MPSELQRSLEASLEQLHNHLQTCTSMPDGPGELVTLKAA